MFKFPYPPFLFAHFSLVIERKKQFFQKRKEKDDDAKCMSMAEKVLREQGRAQRVTNLVPSSNQSMCTGMPDVKEKDCMNIRVA
jgi:hypothetical protein